MIALSLSQDADRPGRIKFWNSFSFKEVRCTPLMSLSCIHRVENRQ